MAWAKPEYSKTEVNKAGDILIAQQPDLAELPWALNVINNWRSSHSFPLNTFQNDLRHKAAKVDTKNLISQRIKPHFPQVRGEISAPTPGGDYWNSGETAPTIEAPPQGALPLSREGV